MGSDTDSIDPLLPLQEPTKNHPGKPRKTYRLTRLGRRVLEADRNRIQSLLETAHAIL